MPDESTKYVSSDVLGTFLTMLIAKQEPSLAEHVKVKIDEKTDLLFAARRSDASTVLVTMGIGPKHPRFGQIFSDVVRACYEIHYNITSAVTMQKGSAPICHRCNKPIKGPGASFDSAPEQHYCASCMNVLSGLTPGGHTPKEV